MLDFRLLTFLTLCSEKNYTKTAAKLHITQPAVTQHIQYLESYYHCKLFTYQNKQLALTENGQKLFSYARPMLFHAEKIRSVLRSGNRRLRFGTVDVLGEYLLPLLLAQIVKHDPKTEIVMQIEHSHCLLKGLQKQKYDFILLEDSSYDASIYCKLPYIQEPFFAVAGPSSHLIGKKVSWQELTAERLLLPSPNSLERETLQKWMLQHEISPASFSKKLELGNSNGIKHLVRQNLGITFLFKIAVKKSLERGTILPLQLEEPALHVPFCFLFLKNSVYESDCRYWYEQFCHCQSQL